MKINQNNVRSSQIHLMKFCNCTFGIMFPTNKYTECNIEGIMCLIKYNDILNAEKSDDDEPGIECSCLPECTRTDIALEMQPIYDEKDHGENFILIDVHFASSTTIKYRTDVTFSQMDLIVGFGGIVSLFLGSSIMSIAEIIYFSTISLYNQYRRSRNVMKQKNKRRLPFLN